MENKKVKISTIVESQLPEFIKENYPLVSELLTEYYRSLESKGSALDIVQNIDEYININNLSKVVENTKLSSNIAFDDDVIHVDSTDGFPKYYGLILINDEIILYKSKTNNSFNECIRGFSGIKEYNVGSSEDFSFSKNQASNHNLNDYVKNLSSVFLKEFFIKVKKQIAFGFENTELFQDVNENIFLKQSKDFYTSKGTNKSFEILFRVLYGQDVEVILPIDYVISPSNAQYRVTRNLVVESIEGDIETLKNKTIFQDEYKNIPNSFATVVDIQKYLRYGIEYYVMMLDYDFDKDIIVSGSIFGDLNIHPKTNITENVLINAKSISVDSTIGFDDIGELILTVGSVDFIIKYNGKTVNQFLNCTGIITSIPAGTPISINTYAYGFSDNGEKIKFRISGVLEDTKIENSSPYHTKKSKGSILTLGYHSKDVKDNNWVFNKSVKCSVSNFENIGGNSYLIETFDDSGINSGDSIEIHLSRSVSGEISDDKINIPGNQVIVPSGSTPGKKFRINNIDYPILDIFSVKRMPNKYKGEFLSDILNVYKDFDDDTVYVASSSLPSYGNDYTPKKYNLTIENNFYNENIIKLVEINDHGFLTGDAVVYRAEDYPNSLNISDGIYYVKRENDKEIKLSRSRNDIDSGRFISFNYVGIGTTSGIITSSQPNIISGINTLGFGISVGNYVFDNYIGIGQTYIQNNTKIADIGINIITLSKPHLSNLNSVNSQFSFRNPTNDSLTLLKLNKTNNFIDSQRLLKCIKEPINDGNFYETSPGTTGILINGVEILNYKSEDVLYYGPIESIKVIKSGKDYDVINPPELEISSSSLGNSKCEAYCGLEGSLHEINIIDPGFNYIDVPSVNIRGGGGSGANAIAKLIDYEYSLNINASNSNNKINLGSNILGFSTYHKFSDGESVIYNTYNNTPIGGLVNGSKYYISVLDDFRVKLHKNFNDAILNINSIDISSYGIGDHTFKCTERKKRLNSLIITNSGSGYKNKKILVPSSGISTVSNTIEYYNHPYSDKDIIYYFGSDQNIVGLDTGRYVVTKIDYKSFKLSNIGIGETSKYFYYDTNQYINFENSGVGTHHFNYEPITIDIVGKIGISSYTSIDTSAKVQPIFTGEITSVYVTNGGVGYGSSDIINYNKQPDFTFKSGSGSRVSPVISNGRILDVLVQEQGSDYNSTPELVIIGRGVGAVLTPVISDGKLIKVEVVNGGVNYDQNTTKIEVISRGSGCKLISYPKIWTINNVKRIIETKYQTDDDSIVYRGNNLDYGLEFTHAYSPKLLRGKVFSQILQDGDVKFRSDIENDNDSNLIKYHSPIIGWAYDGNPIYGPYGYTSNNNKTVKLIESGYTLQNSINRPSTNIFPIGYFVEDYTFTNSGDLDIHNGRFCTTPEYPNGTYAYFTTIDSTGLSNNKPPKFPYIIGNSYKSLPINNNFNINLNQNKFIFNTKNILRNTTPYNTLSENSTYEYFLTKKQLIDQSIDVTSTTKSKIESIKIISGGNNYKVKDKIIFDNTDTGGSGVSARVELIEGKKIVGISQSTYSINDVDFYPQFNGLIGFSSSPHRFNNNDIIEINSLSTNNNDISGSYYVDIIKNNLILDLGVNDATVTGIVTYFYVSGLLDFPYIKENDIFSINNENIKILNIDRTSSRIRILREQDSTVSSAHSTSSILYQIPRRFNINFDKVLKEQFYNINREIYFNPTESLGIGETIGIGYTVTFSNPGIGKTFTVIPEKSIYIQNHNLNTDDKIIYKSNGQIPITVSNGDEEFLLLDNSTLSVTKITDDLIGISTVGLSTNLFFISPGSGDYHSFVTNFDNTLKGNVYKNIVTVSTGSTHNLNLNDKVVLDVVPGITTNIKIAYNDHNRRLIVNPRSFSIIDTINNTILIENHGYVTGQKLLYTSIDTGSLINQNMYYVVVYDRNRIKLSENYYNSISKEPRVINFTNNFSGTLSEINPQIKITKNCKVVFNLNDPSLSESASGNVIVESFDFNIFTDKNLTNKLFLIDSIGNEKIKKTGTIGINGSLEFTIDESFPDTLYYTLTPKTSNNIKNEIYIDTEVPQNNQIVLVDSKLKGKFPISGVSSDSFEIQPPLLENFVSYNQNNGFFKYYTDSSTDYGPIHKIKVTSGGLSYKKLPSITSINSKNGSGAVLIPQSNSIGIINSTKISNIKYSYSIDQTLRPLVKFSSILRIEPLTSVEKIDVLSPGLDYNTSPDLVLIDGFTNNIVDDIYLDFDINESRINIIKNTKGIYNTTPRIISINNTNGLGISSVTYENSSKLVTVYLSQQFSDAENFPIKNGDKVLVEGISTLDSLGKGFNSKNYNYTLFTVQNVVQNLGGSGSIVQYSLSDYLSGNEFPGEFDLNNSSGRIIPEGYLPKFKVYLKKNSFFIGETIFSGEKYGKVLNWDEYNEYVTVQLDEDFDVNDLIVGEFSKSQAFVKEVLPLSVFYNINSSTVVKNGWKRQTGFLNDPLQRIYDSDYYQHFSYSIKSEIPIDKWNIYVNNLNHTLGFKRFSDLVVRTHQYAGIETSQNNGSFTSVCDLNNIIDVDCIKDFDLVSENHFYIENSITTDEIEFNSIKLIDYSESFGNKVLIIDDISDEFNTDLSNTFITSFNI